MIGKLLGHSNWWIPKWLDRILPNLVVEPEDSGPGTSIDPETTPEPVGVA
jgi:RND superfamily putative drug exporter